MKAATSAGNFVRGNSQAGVAIAHATSAAMMMKASL